MLYELGKGWKVDTLTSSLHHSSHQHAAALPQCIKRAPRRPHAVLSVLMLYELGKGWEVVDLTLQASPEGGQASCRFPADVQSV